MAKGKYSQKPAAAVPGGPKYGNFITAMIPGEADAVPAEAPLPDGTMEAAEFVRMMKDVTPKGQRDPFAENAQLLGEIFDEPSAQPQQASPESHVAMLQRQLQQQQQQLARLQQAPAQPKQAQPAQTHTPTTAELNQLLDPEVQMALGKFVDHKVGQDLQKLEQLNSNFTKMMNEQRYYQERQQRADAIKGELDRAGLPESFLNMADRIARDERITPRQAVARTKQEAKLMMADSIATAKERARTRPRLPTQYRDGVGQAVAMPENIKTNSVKELKEVLAAAAKARR